MNANPHFVQNRKILLELNPDQDIFRRSEGTVVVLPDGRWFFPYTRFIGNDSDNAPAEIVYRTSPDSGKSWSEETLLVPREGAMNSMSVSLIELEDKLLLFYEVKNDLSDCVMYVRPLSKDLNKLGERILATPFPGYHVIINDRVVRLKSGRIIIPSAYHPCRDGTYNTWEPRALCLCFFSDDDGQTWQQSQSALTSPRDLPYMMVQEPGVVELNDGRLLMFMRTNRGVQFYSYSADQGFIWSPIEPSSLFSPLSPASIKRIPSTGDLMAIWNDHSGRHAFMQNHRIPLSVALSQDEGQTWSPSLLLEDDHKGCFCYTSITFVNNDIVLAYCAGDHLDIGPLNRTRLIRFPVEALYKEKAST